MLIYFVWYGTIIQTGIYKMPEARAGDVKSTRGKKNHQKMKPYIILEYLMKNSDMEHLPFKIHIGHKNNSSDWSDSHPTNQRS